MALQNQKYGQSYVADHLILSVSDVQVDVLTGIYSEETHLPQPLKISVRAGLAMADHYAPETPLAQSKNYMDLRGAITEGLTTGDMAGVHYTLIEAVADRIIGQILGQDSRVLWVEVDIVKLAISHHGEAIGISMRRNASGTRT
jgi:7,8-dihydroneopterin aldolase/epimerase/oxygenase